MKRSPNDWKVVNALLRKQFGFFMHYAFREVGNGPVYQHNWHIDAIEYQLDRLRAGTCLRAIIAMPPRHLKSIAVSTAWVAWMLGNDPTLVFLTASYGQGLSEKHARDCMKIMQSDWYLRAFPNTRLSSRAIEDFETTAGGGRLSTSVGGVLTGRGADYFVIDDPMKPEDTWSETARATALRWFEESASMRLNNPETSRIIIVMQRLHEADLAGELIRKGGWEERRLSGIATRAELIPLSRGRFHQRREGCALHPARVSLATLHRMRADNSYVFASQVQQDPVAREGAFVKAEWFGTYDVPPTGGLVIMSFDTAAKTTVRNAWSVGIVARYYMKRYYILDVFRKRVEFTDLVNAVRRLSDEYKPTRLLIEDASSGEQLIQHLNREDYAHVPHPTKINPVADKVTRFEAIASMIESGVVVLPQAAPWKAEFVQEVTRFPGGRFFDQADALAQMLGNPVRTTVIRNASPVIVDGLSDDREDQRIIDGFADPIDAFLC